MRAAKWHVVLICVFVVWVALFVAGRPPAVDFTAGCVSGENPLSISFTGLSGDDPAWWNWSFGDGSFSTEQNPEHTYFRAGTYAVSLTAGTFFGSTTRTKEDYISVKQASPVVEMDVAGNLAGWALCVNDPDDNEEKGTVGMEVTSNAPWCLKVKDAMTGGKPVGTGGRMAEYSSSGADYVGDGRVLSYPLQVCVGDGPYVEVTCADCEVMSGPATKPSGVFYDVGARQKVTFSDEVLDGNCYRMVICFTVSAV